MVAKVLATRGDAPGLVHVISAMEACATYQPWHDKASGQTFLRPDTGKCLHYYFYFMDESSGCATCACPPGARSGCSSTATATAGWRAALREGIDFTLADNAFVRIADFARAQALADSLNPEQLHRHLDRYAGLCCPVLEVFEQRYHWSLMQVEYSTDLVFHSEATLKPLYEQLSREAVLAVKAEQVATFLGKKITPQLAEEIGSRFARASRAPASSTSSASPRSSCTTSSGASCASRPPPTTSPSSSTTARWNIAAVTPPANWRRSRSPSTA